MEVGPAGCGRTPVTGHNQDGSNPFISAINHSFCLCFFKESFLTLIYEFKGRKTNS